MKIIITIISTFLFIINNSFAKEIKLQLIKYTNSKQLKKDLPFLMNLNTIQYFIDYEIIAKEEDKINELEISHFIFNNKNYYLIIGRGLAFCGSDGCYFKVYSKEDKKIITQGHITGIPYLKNNTLYFQKSKISPKFEYDLN